MNYVGNGQDPGRNKSFLQNPHRVHRERINEMRSRIHKFHVEKERLAKELSELEMERESAARSDAFMELAMRRAKETSRYILKRADEETQKIAEASREKLAQYDGRLTVVQRQVEHTKEYINLLLRDIQKLFQETGNRMEDSPEPEEAESSILGKIEDDMEETPLPGGENGGPIQPEQDVQAEHLRQGQDFSGAWEIGAIPWSSEHPAEEENLKEEEGQSFWEAEDEGGERNFSHAGWTDEEFKPDMPYREPAAAAGVKREKGEETVGEREFRGFGSTAEEKLPEADEMIKSPGVSGRINLIRQKYLIGKVAGEDLPDQNGGMIVREGEVITPGTVIKAEKAGKLADLIIYAVPPEDRES